MLDKNKMQRIKFGVLSALIIVFLLYILNKWMLNNQFDTSYPQITFEQDVLEVSVSVTEEDLLQGVKATDKKDGDVTETIIIESISKLLEGNQRIVTYAAFDGDNHVGKAERRIQYTDYTPIRFSLEKPLQTSSVSLELTTLLESLRATDCVDGDISDRIVVVNTELTSMTAESIQAVYDVQVTNSCGEVASLSLPMDIKLTGSGATTQYGEIKLAKYLTYAKVGENVDLKSFIESVTLGNQAYSTDQVDISAEIDNTTPGVYTATYSLTREEVTVSCDLIIVIEE